MKNRAAFLALIVLAIATLLMIFVISPWLSGNKDQLKQVADKAAETVKQATEKAGEAAPQAVAQLKEKATATLEKMERLSGGATEAVGAFAALFDQNRLPTTDEFTAARQKAVTSLTDLSSIELPEGIGGDVLANAKKLRDEAVKAIEWLKALPADPSASAPLIGNIRALFPLAFKLDTEATRTGEAKTPAPAANSGGPIAALPSFDVLRVEPDGATVIAGRAAPGVTIEIVSGETVLTKAVTGPNGEFAAVLDDPLPPGDHQLALRATGADGSVALSGEVATVSVPKDKDGQLLAMISTPGQASRLLAIPTTQEQTSAAQPPASTAPAATAATVPDATTTRPADTTAPGAVIGSAPVRVSAVEIENDRIFVAGAARAGAQIRAFAGNAQIGEVTVDPSGHFVVDGAVPLAPGDHIIVVELLDDTGHVSAKVSVPFNRPAGNQVSAVAGEASATTQTAETESADSKTLTKLREDVSKAFTLLKSLFADGKTPDREELAAARSASEFALKSLSEFIPDMHASEAVRTRAAEASKLASGLYTTLSTLPKDAAGIAKALNELTAGIGTLTAPAQISSAATADPKALSQAPLTPSENAVIIRRGDTLWQISRRVYGQGVRYTTIYLANRGEINDPDLIEPGQVFTVPRDALPNAEELHRRRLSGAPLQ